MKEMFLIFLIGHLLEVSSISYHGDTASLNDLQFLSKLPILFQIVSWKMNNLIKIQHNDTQFWHFHVLYFKIGNNNPAFQTPGYNQCISKNV